MESQSRFQGGGQSRFQGGGQSSSRVEVSPGSRVEVSPGSRVEVSPAPGWRSVQLQGGGQSRFQGGGQSRLQGGECGRCFAHFNVTSGVCGAELGAVDQLHCCQNAAFGYQATGSECQFCGPPLWSPWSSWSSCNVQCGDGVRRRSRKCFSLNQTRCDHQVENLQLEPCTGTCCDEKGWSLWANWSPCSVTCGGVGLRKRERQCPGRPGCLWSCSGPSEQTDTCEANNTCPVHGGWSRWSGWSSCSTSCIEDQLPDLPVPARQRRRSCSDPTPSADTVPPGNGCRGDDLQVHNCSELPNCPVDGQWGAWLPPGPCSVTCGAGLQLSSRMCDSPPPKHGGRYCNGPSSRTSVCESPCPVDGFWSGWGSWGDCSSSCIPHGGAALRTRRRSCTNPAPSSKPPGRSCPGDDRQAEDCVQLPRCPVDGAWGSWSGFSACPVTCGVGLRESVRHCDSPAPKHGGHPCPGEDRRSSVCLTDVHCPVDGSWSEWSSWSKCRPPFPGVNINCQPYAGRQSRERFCLHRAHGGAICSGNQLTDRRYCFDIQDCSMTGSWAGWGSWNVCWPTCGSSRRARRRICDPDVSKYRDEQERLGGEVFFFGKPLTYCGDPPEGGKVQFQPCLQLPPCT